MADRAADTTTYGEDLLLDPADRYARLRDARLLLAGTMRREEPLSAEELASRLALVCSLLDEELRTMLHSEPTLDPEAPPTHSVIR